MNTIELLDRYSKSWFDDFLPADRIIKPTEKAAAEREYDRDPAKAGFLPEELEPAVEQLDLHGHLDYRGLMTVGRLVDDPEAARPTFVGLSTLAERLRGSWPRLGPELSMGMTDDFEVAIEEGATIVRIGRALFGHRH